MGRGGASPGHPWEFGDTEIVTPKSPSVSDKGRYGER